MRLLVTGSRSWADRRLLWGTLDHLVAQMVLDHPETFIKTGVTLVSGHCSSGADKMAEEWFKERYPLEEPETYPADWSQGKGAGFARNAAMVDSGPDEVAAFIMPCTQRTCRRPETHGTHGAMHCSDYAESKGLPVHRVYGGNMFRLSQ